MMCQFRSAFTLHLAVQCNQYELFLAGPVTRAGNPYNYNQVSTFCANQGGYLPDGWTSTASISAAITPPSQITSCVINLIRPYVDAPGGEAGNIWSSTCYTSNREEICVHWIVLQTGTDSEIRRDVPKSGNKHFIYPVCQRGQCQTAFNVVVREIVRMV